MDKPILTRICNICKECVLAFVVISITIVFSPLLLLIVGFFYIWRLIAILLAKACTKYGDILTGIDLAQVIDKYNQNPHSAIGIILILKGDSKVFLQQFSSVLTNKNPNGSYRFDKLFQYPVHWMGYRFWKNYDNYNFDNHVKFSSQSVTENNLQDFLGERIRYPFAPNQSMWDVTIVPNYNGNRETFVAHLRIHHGLADGMSVIKMLHVIFNTPENQINFPKPTIPKYTRLQRLSHWLQTTIGLPYVFIRNFIDSQDKNCIQDNVQGNKDWFCSFTSPVSLEEIRMAAKTTGSSTTTILFTALSGGFHSYVAKCHGDRSVPKHVHVFRSIFLAGHPDDRFVNHWGISIIKLPIKVGTIQKRLESIQTAVEIESRSPIPFLSNVIIKLTKLLTISLVEPASKLASSTIIMSNTPGPSYQCNFFGMPVLDIINWLPILSDKNAISIMVFTYNGKLRMTLMANKFAFQTKEQLNKLTACIDQELQEILQIFTSTNSCIMIENNK